MLIDQCSVRLAFSALALKGGGNCGIPLPITISPDLPWRLDIILNESVCTAISVFNNFRHERMLVKDTEWGPYFEGEVWEEVKRVTFEAAESNYVLSRPEEEDHIRAWLEQAKRTEQELKERKMQVAALTAALAQQQANAQVPSTTQDQSADAGTLSCYKTEATLWKSPST